MNTMMHLLSDLLRTFAKPPEMPEAAMSEHEKFLAYAEEESRKTLDDLRAAFNAHFERALKVLTLLTGGAGAVAEPCRRRHTHLGVACALGPPPCFGQDFAGERGRNGCRRRTAAKAPAGRGRQQAGIRVCPCAAWAGRTRIGDRSNFRRSLLSSGAFSGCGWWRFGNRRRR